MTIKLVTDFNKYCFIDSTNETFNKFNLNMIVKEKNSKIIIDELLKLYNKSNKHKYYDSFHIYQNIDEFTKYNIDYKKLNENFLKFSSKKNISNNIPKELLLSQTQINQLIINEIKKINRNKQYLHFVFPDSNNPYILNIILKINNKNYELKLFFNQKLHPFMPPKLEYIKPKIKLPLLLSILNLDILKLENWNPTTMLQDLIVNLAEQLEPIIENYLVNENYCELNYELTKLASITKTIDYVNLISLIKNNSASKITSKTETKYWNAGTGYGNDTSATKWDINNYIKEQELQNEELTNCLHNINKLINNYEVNNDSILLSLLLNKNYSLTILELDKNRELYTEIFNILANLIIKNLHQTIINKLAYSLNNIFEQVNLLLNTSPETSNDEFMLQVFCVADWYISHAETLINELTITHDIKENYCNVMKKLQFGTFDIDNNHRFKNHTQKPEQKALIRISSEISSFKSSLPLNWESTIWTRISKTNLNIFSFLISGPKDTPYENGLFEFHASFPTDYPQSVPQVLLHTTGNNTVRFNPNLYDSGKVCLSLLGTWKGDEGESWNPKTSTFLQILISIQSLILVEQPYFNEPGYEKSMNTPDGKSKSNHYNYEKQPHTIKYAMTDMIKNPPKGFEEVVTNHFKIKKDEIINKTLIWQQNNPKVQNNRDELLGLLLKI
jgi:ubiquitin-protein ligase